MPQPTLNIIEDSADLYRQAVATDLTEMERVAFALALDVEN